MVTLESILREHFDCQVPFLASGKPTTECETAVEKLINLLHDCEDLGLCTGVSNGEKEIEYVMHKNIDKKCEYIEDFYKILKELESKEGLSEDYRINSIVNVNFEDGSTMPVIGVWCDDTFDDVFVISNDNPETVRVLSEATEESVRSVYITFKSQLIEEGWDWRERAIELLSKKHPEIENDESIFDFVGEYWMNLGTDAWNIGEFEATL